ncbi:hypothetical protein PTKIN_Ptkin17bG0064200 [Pterospermum kingtungense]
MESLMNGAANDGEDLRKAAMRELKEETGVIYILNVNRNVVYSLCYEVTISYVTAGIFSVEKDEKALMKAIANQPVIIAIDAGGKDFQFYSEGIVHRDVKPGAKKRGLLVKTGMKKGKVRNH